MPISRATKKKLSSMGFDLGEEWVKFYLDLSPSYAIIRAREHLQSSMREDRVRAVQLLTLSMLVEDGELPAQKAKKS